VKSKVAFSRQNQRYLWNEEA